MFDRVVLAGFCIAAGCVGFLEPRVARADEVVFEDHELSDWQFLVPPGDPEIEIEHAGAGDAFLTVRQHHTAPSFSLKRSIQGSPQAQYAPVTSGAVESLAFAGRFRVHWEGVGIVAFYAIRAISVQAVVRQGDQTFIVSRTLFLWIDSDATLNQWVSVASGPLVASDFLLDGLSAVHPDFSPAGEPMTLALRVSSSYRTGFGNQLDNTFAIDIDDVRVTAEAPTAGGLPQLSFRSQAPLLDMTCGPLAVGVGQLEGGTGVFGMTVQVSEVASTTRFFRMLLDGNGVDFALFIDAGASSTRIPVVLSPERPAMLFQLVSGEGTSIGEPSRFALFVSNGTGCAISTQWEWRNFLHAQGCDPVGGGTSPAASSASAPSGTPGTQATSATPAITALQALRDEVMATTPAGRYYAELYKTLSPAIVRTLLAHPPLLLDLFLSQDAWIDALTTLTEGGANTAQVSAGMAGDLNRLLDGFETQGSPALRRTIARERARLGLSAISGLTMNQFWQRVNDRWDPEPCVADDYGLCLGGGRYRVETDWATPAGGIGGSGRGRAVALSGDSGYFWFFDPANVEILTKVIDGCGFNQRVWSYSAGLTNLEVDLFVFDTATGRGKSYENPQATSFAPILDSDYLECVSAPQGAAASSSSDVSPAAPPNLLPLAGATCVPAPETLCLGGGRFRVEADWRTAAGAAGAAHAAPLTGDTGTFWFFNAANIELVVKTIDACGLAGFDNYWLFAAGTTDVDVTLRVTDTMRDVSKSYHRPLGQPFAPILDTVGFDTCP